MAINKENFKSYLWNYRALGMSPREAYQRMLKEGLDDSIANIPSQVSNLVNAGIPFERALDIVEEATFNNNFDPYRAALQEYRSKGRVYRSPEPNGRDRIDVNKIVRDALGNKSELGNGYYPPMGMSTFPNSQHSQYSVVPEQPITEGMSPTPSQYPYETDAEANQELAPEGYTPIPVSRYYTPIPANVPTTDANSNVSAPSAESNTMQVYDTKTGTTNTYNSSTGELVSTSSPKQNIQAPKTPSVNSAVKRANTPRVQQKRAPAVTPTVVPTPTPVANAPVIPASTTRSVMPVPNKTSLASAYKRDLWNLINSKGISSPAEAVQRGIIPAEYLNLF